MSGKHSKYRGAVLARYLDAGWTFSQSGDRIQCPLCGIRSSCCEPIDEPTLLHQKLSPFCLFILSLKYRKKTMSKILLLDTNDVCSSIDVTAGRRQQRDHLAIPSRSLYSELSRRETSFCCAPNGPPPNVGVLVKAGFYYDTGLRSVECFYCHRGTDVPVEYLESKHPWPMPKHHEICAYHQQMDDGDRFDVDRSRKSFSSIRSLFIRMHSSVLVSNLCGWCEKEPVRYVAFPCHHLSMCEMCSRIRFCCPRCFIPFRSRVEIFL